MTTILPHYRTFNDDGASPQISLLDFNDSFTFNIASNLFDLGIPFRIVEFHQIMAFLTNPLNKGKKHVFIYGPGPGRPDDYRSFFPKIEKLLEDKNSFHLGVCLGHQILWKIKGANIERSLNPLHGQSVNVKIPHWEGLFPKKFWSKEVVVQRYNSLAVKDNGEKNNVLYDGNREMLMGYFERTLTYQFHPESIGTSFPSLFFGPVSHFLYN
tara:strand:+ start:709 stop:1344 length:636 start_codon:yes stop_codon:yes gene_type:complete